jgi:SAM-dependent methyltransferase
VTEPDDHQQGVDLRTDQAHPARMYDYYLNGKSHFPADRDAAEAAIAAYPQTRDVARANRGFLGRAVRFAAARGIRQFLDVGTGIPSPGNTNEVAGEVAPDSRVVYVDNDPIVLTHARALLAGMDPARRTRVLLGDLREPAALLAESARVLDPDRPVALLLVAILHFIKDEEDPAGLVRELLAALAPGSCLILSHATADGIDAGLRTRGTDIYRNATAPLVFRGHDEVSGFFAGTELVEPGLVLAHDWRPDAAAGPPVAPTLYAGVGVKP